MEQQRTFRTLTDPVAIHTCDLSSYRKSRNAAEAE